MIRILILAFLLSSCAQAKHTIAYRKAYSDRQCNHNHMCCQVGCACCGSAQETRQQFRKQKRVIRKYRRELKRTESKES